MVANIEKLAKVRGAHNCTILDLDTVTPEPVRWIWPGHIPDAMFTLLAGQPGVGKTTLSYYLAATITTGGQWPFSDDHADEGIVVILTAEDDPVYTLAPKLIAAGADLKRIKVIQSVMRPQGEQVIDAPLLLSEDMHQLHGVLEQYPSARMLILDPLSAYLGVKDSHRDSDVRQVLGPLTDLAATHGVAVLGITHLSKNASNSAMARFMGSTGIIAAARAAFLVARHEDDIVMLPVKLNVGPKPKGMIYRIVGKTIGQGIETSCIEWVGETDIDADEALNQQTPNSPKMTEAMEFLESELAYGSKLQKHIEQSAERAGITRATVRRAKKDLKIESHKDQFGGKWKWYTPEQYALKIGQENK